MLYMPEDPERRRSRNAKRFLWAVVAGIFIVLGLIVYTSLSDTDQNSSIAAAAAWVRSALP